MKNFNNLIICIFIITLFNSCGSIKEGFSMQKKDNTDEFLVEKKNPLKLPPNFNELPIPNSGETPEKPEKIKDLIVKSENDYVLSEHNAKQKAKVEVLDDDIVAEVNQK
mgnify:CR=1 FL=1